MTLPWDTLAIFPRLACGAWLAIVLLAVCILHVVSVVGIVATAIAERPRGDQ